MKTTLHLHRHAPVTAPPAARPSTARLGLGLSAAAAIATIVLEAVADVPVVLILIPVVLVGFALSWYASGRRATTDDDHRAA
jgi:hypothetical protein